MYGLDGQNRRLVQVELSSGAVTKVADLPFTSGWSGFDYNPADGFLYAAVGGANRSNAIYKIDPRTGVSQLTGSVVSPGGDGSFESIGFRNNGSLLAYDEHFDMPSGHLLSVNLAAGTSQILGSSRTPSCLGGDFDATRNTFWVSDEWNGKLYQLNPTNGSIVWTSTSTWYTGNGSGDMFDVDVAANGMVYVTVTDRGAHKILRCDPSTGQWTEQCTVPVALRLASVPGGDTPLPQPPQITSTNLWRGTVGVLFSNQLTANGSVPITFGASNPPAGLTLSTNGLILGNPTTAGTNMALITASNTVGVARQTNTFIIAKGTPVISNWPTGSPISFGQALSNSVLSGGSASVPGSFGWTSPTNRPNAGTNSFSVTFVPTDTNNWNTVSTNISFVVNPASPVLTWAPSPVAGLTYPSTLSSAQLNATSSVPGRFTYTPPVGTVLNPGTNTLVATFQPTDTANFLANRTITNTVVVARGLPQVTTWPSASPISLGQTLSNSVLSGGVANVPGSFAWSSPGQQPSLGTNAYSVTFIPSATNNYQSVTGNVSVVVNPTSDTFPSSGQWTLRWNGSNAPSWYQPWMLSISDGKYLAGMTVSDNGIQWRSMTNPTDVRHWINNIGYGNGTYLITGAANDLWNGTNEVRWTKRGVPGSYDDLTQISYGNGVFVARGYWSQGGVLVSSNNGNNWTYVNTGTFNYAPGTDSRHYCFLRYGNGRFFYPLFDSVRTSSNGLNWTTTAITNRPAAFRMSSAT